MKVHENILNILYFANRIFEYVMTSENMIKW